jgi:GT2 family glycosyltransferase/glycosyltransferase involved in cell wall biosynthesis
MSEQSESLSTLLAFLDPRRLVLVGPDGPTLRAALAWARRTAAVRVLRQADGAGAGPEDVLVSEQAGLLPDHPVVARAAVVPASEMVFAAQRGWVPAAEAREGTTVLRRAEAAHPGIELRLEAYARSRLAMSRELEALNGRDANGLGASRPPAPAAAAGPELEPARAAPAVSVIVPVYNAAHELRRCLHSLSRHTTWPCEVLIVDDASTEPGVADVLAEAERLSGVRILRNATNLGFTATVNRALRSSRGDVVLLNSDTEVGPGWLEHLVRAGRSRPAVATVTPLSDNAGAFAVPEVGQPNATPLALDLSGVARRVAQLERGYVEVPTGNGFCMYIARQALDTLGHFDAEAFPRGYGEENDLCMRALRAGWIHLLDPRTFVHHVREASFGDERPELMRAGRARINSRYPEFTKLIRQWISSDEMATLRSGVQDAYRETDTPRPRILTVIHEGGGGTWIANLELMRALEPEWDPFVLTSDRRTLRLWHMSGGELVPTREWTLERSIRVTDFARADYAAVVRDVLEQQAIELVHVRHLFKHTFDAPHVAAALGVPVVFSFHDFYFTCPTVNLLDNNDMYCAAQCTPGDGECRVPAAGLEGLPHLKHSYVYQWREEVAAMLSDVDALVTTSAHARSVHLRALPSLTGRPFELIEHGRALRQQGGFAAAPEPGGPVKILVVANIDIHKGAEYIRALRAADTGGRLEFHLLGLVPPEYGDLGVGHGTFAHGELEEHVKAIAPAFTGHFSIVAETYSHSLTESWALGLPVIANDIGAFGERIRAHGGGQLTPLDDPAEAVSRIYAAAEPHEYERLRAEATLRGCATVADMTDEYTALYRSVLDGRRALPARADGPVQLRPGVVKLQAVVPGADGVHPGSTYVRIVQRYRHPGVAHKLSVSVRLSSENPLSRDADLVLVQRTALEPAAAEDFIAALHDRGAPLALDLDDHLLIKGRDDPDYGPHQEALAALIDAARVVLVSTERLADALRHQAREVALVPNLLDERLFLSGVEKRPRASSEPADRPLRLVYVGSTTHADDLAMLRPVMAELARRSPGAFELNVVGVEPSGPDQEWYRRVVVPDQCKPYPRFVRWLRLQRPGWDVAVAPLRDTEFNRYKSDLKFLEYAALGLPSVYSDREPYATVGDRRTGLKVSDATEAWIDALTALAGNPELRESIAEEAFREVTSARLLRHGTEDLLAIICAAVGADAPAAAPGRGPALATPRL